MDGRRLVVAFFALCTLQLGIASARGGDFLESPGAAAEPQSGSLFGEPPASQAWQPTPGESPRTPANLTGLWDDPAKPVQAPLDKLDYQSCCNMCPCMYAVVEALILERNLQGSSFPLVVDATTGATLVSTNDVDFPFAGGLRAYAGYRFCGCWALELGYLGLFDANASGSVSGDLTLPGDVGPGSNVFFGADTITWDYTSRIHSGEANFVCCCCCCVPGCREYCRSTEWIYGFRYVRLDEVFTLGAERQEVGGLETGSYEVRASNDLYGPQFGVRLRHCWGRWSVEGTGKVGVFYNDANMNQTITDFPAFVLRQTSDDDDTVAFMGELNATLIRQITDHWYVRGGYNLIWLDGVALAPSQLDFTLTSTSGTEIDPHDTLFLHGVNVGLEARW